MEIKSISFTHRPDYSEGIFQLFDPWVSAGDMRAMQRLIAYDYWAEIDPDGPGSDEWMIDAFRVDGGRLTLRIEPIVLCGREAA